MSRTSLEHEEKVGYYAAPIEPMSAAAMTQSEMDAAAIAKTTWDKFASISPDDEKHQAALAEQAVQQAYASGVNLEQFEQTLRNSCPPGLQDAMRDRFVRQVEAEGRKVELTRDEQRQQNDKEMASLMQGVLGGAEKAAGFTALGEIAGGASAGLGATTVAAAVPLGVKSFIVSDAGTPDIPHDRFFDSLAPGVTPGAQDFEQRKQEAQGTYTRAPRA